MRVRIGLVIAAVAACSTEVPGVGGLGEGSTSGAASTGVDTSTTVATEATTESSTTEDVTSVDPPEESSSSSSGNGGSLCGDGVISGPETCDCAGEACTAEGLDNKTCLDIGDPQLTGGTLDCSPTSCQFDVSGCSVCGDGVIEGIEICDGNLDEPPTCEELGRGTAGDVVCARDCTYDTSDCTLCAYEFDFADCDEGWTTGESIVTAANSSWECGDPPGDPPPYGPPVGTTGVWATRLDGFYSANESSWLRSPPLDFGVCAGEQLTLTLTHWHNFEASADGGIVQVRPEGGEWITVTPSDGAEYGDEPIIATFPPVDGSLGFDGGTGDQLGVLSTSEFDLSEYAGQDGFRVRLVFGSNYESVAPGWYIDAVAIIGGE